MQKQTIESADAHDTSDEDDDDDNDNDDDDNGDNDYVDNKDDDDERLMERDCRDGQQDPRMADEQSP